MLIGYPAVLTSEPGGAVALVPGGEVDAGAAILTRPRLAVVHVYRARHACDANAQVSYTYNSGSSTRFELLHKSNQLERVRRTLWMKWGRKCGPEVRTCPSRHAVAGEAVEQVGALAAVLTRFELRALVYLRLAQLSCSRQKSECHAASFTEVASVCYVPVQIRSQCNASVKGRNKRHLGAFNRAALVQ